uniref:Uncharacterized protein n=1 Tax=Zooxanthella nutricula TaxID=1333877 RepID=A0A7S2P8A9_9DINO
MKLAILPATAATAEALGALSKEGAHALAEDCVAVPAGGALTPKEDACYSLQFDVHSSQSLYTVNASDVNFLAFFAEHLPTEFESDMHYFKDSVGGDVEPAAELPEKEKQRSCPELPLAAQGMAAKGLTGEEWAGSFGAALIVNIVTLVGVVLAVPGISRLAKAYANAFEGILSAFAAGTLLACALFLLLFEATHFIATGWEEEVAQLWRWGTMALAGFILPAVMDVAVAAAAGGGTAAASVGDGDQAAVDADPRSRARVIGAVLIGDFFHNLCDGFCLGAAFKGCGAGFGWGVALATVLHELPQGLADYAILTGSLVRMSASWALLLNFLSGLPVIIGVLVMNLSDVADSAVGLLLAFGGGVYLYIAAVECMPKIHRLQLSVQTNGLCLLSFFLGALIIGLILLDHEHCALD